MKKDNSQTALDIARNYLTLNEGKMPSMLVGFTETGESIALLGTFRDYQEQLTFCTIAHMTFILHKVREYHILTFGGLKDQDIQILTEVAVDARSKQAFVYQVNEVNGNFEFEQVHDFEKNEIDGMFTTLLPTKAEKLATGIAETLPAVIANIRYIPVAIPEIMAELNGLDVLFGSAVAV